MGTSIYWYRVDADDLEDIIFSQHFVEQKQKKLTCGD